MVDEQEMIRRRLKELLDSGNMTRKDLVEWTGATPQAVSKWLKTGQIRITHLIEIADRCRLPIDWFVRDTSDSGHEASRERLLEKLGALSKALSDVEEEVRSSRVFEKLENE